MSHVVYVQPPLLLAATQFPRGDPGDAARVGIRQPVHETCVRVQRMHAQIWPLVPSLLYQPLHTLKNPTKHSSGVCTQGSRQKMLHEELRTRYME